MLKRNLMIIILFSIMLILPSVSALEYGVEVTSPSSVNVYEGDISSQFSFVITNNAGICDITCDWNTKAGGYEGIEVAHDDSSPSIPFDVKADGSNGVASYNLIITCDRISSWNCWSDPDQRSFPDQFSYLWNGDGVCTTTNEKCDNYLSYKKDSACACPSTKECRPDGNRTPDSKGCQNYCGNGICEKSEGESCSVCPDDCKRCDLSSCSIGSECEGNYCVWGVCWHSAIRVGDGHCDSSKGEDCSNSPEDCACPIEQRCSSTTNQCETYCGNGICEASENGICKADCKWCGDGSCDSDQKENCNSCESDCGVCENQMVNQELQEKTKGIVESELQQTSDRQKRITYFGIGAIILVVLGYGLFKFVKSKKNNRKHRKK